MKKRKPKTPKDPIRKKNGKIRLHALTLEEDLKYRGPLSYREFKIFGWLCIVIAQIIILMRLGIKVNPQGLEGRLSGWMDFLSWISPLALPFLLMSNFAVMLDNRKSYKSLIMTNALMMLGMFLMFILLFYHFLIGSLEGLSDGNMNFKDFFTKMYYEGEGQKFFAFNIFVDLFLCSVFMFFVNYRPTRFFQGKKRIIFRLFAILPIAYELVSLALKWLSFDNTVRIPFILFPLLTVKPPMTFVVFVALTLFVKRREKKYIKMGGTYEGYQEFLQTNRNSFTFSLHATIIMFVAGALDLILVIIIPSVQIVLAQQAVAAVSGAEAAATYDMDTAIIGLMSKMFTIGVGGASQLIVFAPIMLLFSYTRKRDNKIIDTLIPVAAIVLMLLVYLQGFFQLMYNLPISGKINFKQIVDTADELKVYLPQMMNMVV
ncbi:MAG: hypothetical protein II493_00920 [Spirochaetales bacterium]|nr:hypothetical protein [Spirochaetales bacterium]